MAEETANINLQLTWTDPRSGEAMEQIFSLPFSVGRDSGNQLMLPSTSVSRHHATFEADGHKVILTDHQSSNGTYVNSQQIEKTVLKDGDEIIFGEVKVALTFTREKEKRPSRPTREHLFDALYQGEAEKTISLKDIRGKSSSLFVDFTDTTATIQSPKPDANPLAEINMKPLAGDELKHFISGRMQKDMAADISDEVNQVADSFRRNEPTPSQSALPKITPRPGSEEDTVADRDEFEAMLKPPKASPAPATPDPKPEGLIARIFRRLIGG
jgi:pSer/pThr/pTyr-binding forkhead associated (FHA) protein